MRPPLLWTLTAGATLALAGLGTRRALIDRAAAATEADLFAVSAPLPAFSEDHLGGLPEPARRYLRHALAPGTPLSPAVRLVMRGAMTTPTAARTTLTALETLAPRRGFVWTARARMSGLPVRVRDHYGHAEGGIEVVALGLLPLPMPGGPDVTRSSRGRLVAEAVWCPMALVHPAVTWEALGPDRARFTLAVDGEAVAVTLLVAPDGALRAVTLDRWGDVEGRPFRPLPYGFRVEEEGTFGGVTIPTRLTGGWLYGSERFDPARAASFTVEHATFAR